MLQTTALGAKPFLINLPHATTVTTLSFVKMRAPSLGYLHYSKKALLFKTVILGEVCTEEYDEWHCKVSSTIQNSCLTISLLLLQGMYPEGSLGSVACAYFR